MKIPLPTLANVRMLGIAAVAGGIVHICTTFVAQYHASDAIYERLSRTFAANTMHVIAPITPDIRILAFFGADTSVAICRFDASGGPIRVEAILSGAGWSLVVYARDGGGIDAVSGQDDKQTDIKLLLKPPGDRFFQGPTSEALGLQVVPLPTPEGMVVLRAPLKGAAYKRSIETDLKRARCQPT
ncbi:MAG: hypothetical protein ACREC6_05610, partial [Hyphomicrobiaceae bacterium]